MSFLKIRQFLSRMFNSPVDNTEDSSIRRLGYKPDLADIRDHTVGVEFKVEAPVTLPESFDLRPLLPPLFNQGNLGSCSSNGIGTAIGFDRKREKLTEWVSPSRLFIYYNERAMEGSINSDSGASIRDGIKSIATLGAPPETLWPYVISKFTTKPPESAYTEALKHKAVEYARVSQTTNAVKSTIAAGYPIIIGISVYDSFMSEEVAKSGIIPMPQPNESLQGGHCIVIAGYTPKYVIVANWWGEDWGIKGFCLIPWEYINSALTSDLWVVRVTK